ncbi:hypothetical protein KTI62_03660 [Acinetobacter schindleri]|uniref:HAD family hydrolase n=1 Tax=Acinetobacter schindleri TaxID=108981 RepID=UPI0021CD9DD0|nr:hypothetical protein [Acinetobacter schindleri]MCU4519285.1 hypothetical protein [Acinetobacter schindleri]
MDNQQFKVYSFDIFDTLFTRPYARPADLFCDVAKRLISERELLSSVCPQAFMRARMKAEHQARQLNTDKDDITIDHIYDQFTELKHWGVSKEIALDTELELELAAVIPIRENVEWVQTLQQQGHRVIFISDMYLPTHWLQKMLAKAGVEAQLSEMYVSGEIGLLKHTGRLFKYVLQKEQIKPTEMHHLGDNPSADVAQAKKHGIVVTHYKKSQLNSYEAWQSDNSEYDHERSKFAGISRACRLACVSGNPAVSQLAANVVAPLLTGFVAYVLDDAEKRGIKNLCFVSRDGQIFYKIAQELLKHRPNSSINCHYIYGSRRAWYLASIFETNKESLLWAAESIGCEWSSFRDITRRLNLVVEDVEWLAKKINLSKDEFDSKQDEAWIEQLLHQLNNSYISEKLIKDSEEHRNRLLKYLKAHGFYNGERVALVDIGWVLRMQKVLKKILLNSGVNVELSGYYLGVINEHEPINETGEVFPFVVRNGSDLYAPLVGDWFFKVSSIMLLEHVFTSADHTSLTEYFEDDNGVVHPICKVNMNAERITEFVNNIHAEVINYARLATSNLNENLLSTAFRRYTFNAVQNFSLRPVPSEVEAIGWIPVSGELTHDTKHQSKLASPLRVLDIIAIIRQTIFKPKQILLTKNYVWLHGAAALSSWHIKFIFNSLEKLQKVQKLLKK